MTCNCMVDFEVSWIAVSITMEEEADGILKNSGG
jgi:hypothetical protein